MAQNENYLKLNSGLVEMPNLSPRAKLLYGYIVSLSQKNGYCYATNAFFISKLKVSERTVTRTLTELRKAKLISSTWGTRKNGSRGRLIFLITNSPNLSTIPRQDCPPNPDKPVCHNNKRNKINDISYESKFGIKWD